MKGLLVALALFVCAFGFAQDQLQTETSNMIQFAAGRAAQLAEAIPADKYSWTPEEGVRSVAGVVAHMTAANYFFAMKLGTMPPEDMNLQTLEQDLTAKDKSELVASLKASIGHITGAIKNIDSSTLGDKVEFPFPGEFTTMSAILIIQGHNNEHLGQLVAYGRSNGVTPPWSE